MTKKIILNLNCKGTFTKAKVYEKIKTDNKKGITPSILSINTELNDKNKRITGLMTVLKWFKNNEFIFEDKFGRYTINKKKRRYIIIVSK